MQVISFQNWTSELKAVEMIWVFQKAKQSERLASVIFLSIFQFHSKKEKTLKFDGFLSNFKSYSRIAWLCYSRYFRQQESEPPLEYLHDFIQK